MPAPSKEKVEVSKLTAERISVEPSHEEIALRAYLLYLERGAIDGQDLSDWLQAEAALAGETVPSKRVAKAG